MVHLSAFSILKQSWKHWLPLSVTVLKVEKIRIYGSKKFKNVDIGKYKPFNDFLFNLNLSNLGGCPLTVDQQYPTVQQVLTYQRQLTAFGRFGSQWCRREWQRRADELDENMKQGLP